MSWHNTRAKTALLAWKCEGRIAYPARTDMPPSARIANKCTDFMSLMFGVPITQNAMCGLRGGTRQGKGTRPVA